MDITAILIGAATALILWGVVLRFRGADGRRAVSVLLAAMIPALVVGVTHYSQGAGWRFPPNEFMDAALLFGAGAVVVGTLYGLGQGVVTRAAALLVFLTGMACLFTVYTESLHERYWDGQVLLYVACMTAVAGFALGGRLIAGAQGRTTEAALATALAALCASPALGWSGTGVTAMDIAALSSSAGLFGLLRLAACRWNPDDDRPVTAVGSAAAFTQTALFAGLVANGVLYAETPRKAGVLLLAAPLLVLLPGKSLVASIVRLTLVAGVAAAAAYLSQGEPNPYGY